MQSYLIKIPSSLITEHVNQLAIDKILTVTELTHPRPQPADIRIIKPDGSSLKIEQIRQLISELSYKTRLASPRVFILWQTETLTIPAQNALLKVLEEPPANTFLILVTTQPEVLLPTIKSRCLQIEIKPEDNKVDKSNTETANILSQITSPATLYTELMELAAKYDRETAPKVITDLINLIHKLPNYPNSNQIKQMQILNQTLLDLKANVNTKLALESAFFQIKLHT